MKKMLLLIVMILVVAMLVTSCDRGVNYIYVSDDTGDDTTEPTDEGAMTDTGVAGTTDSGSEAAS